MSKSLSTKIRKTKDLGVGRIGLCRPSRPSTIIARLRQCAQGWMSHPACGYPFVGGVPTRIAHELTGPATEAACKRVGFLEVLPTDDFSNEFTRPSRARRITAADRSNGGHSTLSNCSLFGFILGTPVPSGEPLAGHAVQQRGQRNPLAARPFRKFGLSLRR